jgi:hypothetical protein
MDKQLRTICVFCGSSRNVKRVYVDAAKELGRVAGERGLSLVYGGGSTGLMGAVADAALASGVRVTGVIPRSMVEREIAHASLTELRIVESMHQRKALMADLSDAFVAMPGGYGTLDEFCEALTWSQLEIHAKPCGLWNVEGYYDRLTDLFDHAQNEGLLKPQHRALVIVERGLPELLERMAAARPDETGKW